MYIEPNTVIKVLRNIPWNNTYEDTVMFASQSAQLAYMNTMVKYTFQDQTYNRVNKGVSRVKMKAENLYDCNYMMFQNSNFGNKWFFAFINKVEYINNEVSEIYFEIDEVQTWLFDFEILRCFVEREHSVTDEIGENLLPEPVALGQYVMESIQSEVDKDIEKIVRPDTVLLYTSYEAGGAPAEGEIVNHRVYSGMNIMYERVLDADGNVDLSAVTTLNGILQSFVGDNLMEGIVNIVMCPIALAPDPETPATYSETIRMPNHAHASHLGGNYVPKNNKLYTYPYSYLYITTGNGNGAQYKYEHFTSAVKSFNLRGSIVGSEPQMALFPNDYIEGSKYDNLLILSSYPTVAFAYDTFKAYLAQNKYRIAGQIISAGVSGVSGAFITGLSSVTKTGDINPVAEAIGATHVTVGALNKAISVASEMATASIQPPQTKGQHPADTLWAENGLLNFYFYDASIDEEHAKVIDDFFTRFGYTTNRLKVPNRDSRPYWNYVKTGGCIIQGNLPADSIRKLCDIHDKGITYWRSGTVVGHYELDNRPNNGGTANE